MKVDCGDCVLHNLACADCVVSVLLGVPDPAADSDERAPEADDRGHLTMPLQQDERDAMAALAQGGLIPHLRLIGRTESERSPERGAPSTKGRTRRTG